MISLARSFTARFSRDGHVPIIAMEIQPPRWATCENEIEEASRQAFTAYELALRRGHEPRLWEAVKGSPFQANYEMNVGRQR